MYTLYCSPGSSSMAPHGVLEESGAPYALRLVDMGANEHKDADYLRLNPHGQVPMPVVDDGPPMLSGGPYLLGERFCAADIHLQMLYSWMDPSMHIDERCRNVKRCADLVAARPGIGRMLQRNGVA